MRKPLVIDLFCGLGGWTRGFMAEGYDCIGFDIERHQYGEKRYPAQLVLQDVLTLHGGQFRDAAVIVASPPCQAYSYRAMPWKRAKALPPPDNSLFDACWRIAEESAVPIVIENVRGAEKWVGPAKWHYGSYYLWGDVPALMPTTLHRKVPDMRFDGSGRSFQSAAVDHLKRPGRKISAGFNNWPKDETGSYIMPDGSTVGSDGVKQPGLAGPAWFDQGAARLSSRSLARKAASAMIAEIPFDLAVWIARCFKPTPVLHPASEGIDSAASSA